MIERELSFRVKNLPVIEDSYLSSFWGYIRGARHSFVTYKQTA